MDNKMIMAIAAGALAGFLLDYFVIKKVYIKPPVVPTPVVPVATAYPYTFGRDQGLKRMFQVY